MCPQLCRADSWMCSLYNCTNNSVFSSVLFGQNDWGTHGIKDSLISLFQPAKQRRKNAWFPKSVSDAMLLSVSAVFNSLITDRRASRIWVFCLALKCSLSIAGELIAKIPSINRFFNRTSQWNSLVVTTELTLNWQSEVNYSKITWSIKTHVHQPGADAVVELFAFQQTFYIVFLRFYSLRHKRKEIVVNRNWCGRTWIDMFGLYCPGAENLNKPHAVFFLNTTQQTPPHCFLSRIWTFTVIVNCFFVKIEGFSSVGRQFVSLSESIESDQILDIWWRLICLTNVTRLLQVLFMSVCNPCNRCFKVWMNCVCLSSSESFLDSLSYISFPSLQFRSDSLGSVCSSASSRVWHQHLIDKRERVTRHECDMQCLVCPAVGP